jgi:hypothetical protein
MLLNGIFSAAGLAASLYSIFTTTEKLCSKADRIVDSKLDIWTEDQVLGSESMTLSLRSKSERRLIKKYNKVIIKCMSLRFKTQYLNWEAKTDWEREEISFLFRIHTSMTVWWTSGFTGQFINGTAEIDPRVMAVFKELVPEDRVTVSKAQILILARGTEKMS